MFESIGQKGFTKPLPRTRWLLSILVGGLQVGLVLAVHDLMPVASVATAMPTEPETMVDVFTIHRRLEPKPPRPIPTSTTRPKKARKTLSRKVTPKVIQDPVPTPRVEEPKPEVTPEVALDESDLTGSIWTGTSLLDALKPGREENGKGLYAYAEPVTVDFSDVEILYRAPVAYPPLARRQRIEGIAVVEITCSADGRVTDVRWISGNEIFKEEVMKSARAFRYRPQPIPFRFQQPFRFGLR